MDQQSGLVLRAELEGTVSLTCFVSQLLGRSIFREHEHTADRKSGIDHFQTQQSSDLVSQGADLAHVICEPAAGSKPRSSAKPDNKLTVDQSDIIKTYSPGQLKQLEGRAICSRVHR